MLMACEPRDPLRTGAALVLAGGVVVTGAAAAGVGFALALSSAYPFKAAAVPGLVAAISLARVRNHHPHARFGLANGITTVRAGLLGTIAGLIGERTSSEAAVLAIGAAGVALLLDGVDGFAARRQRLASTFGARYDVEVDAALILVLAILAWVHGKAGPWILGAGLLRYAWVAAGALLPWMRGELAPTLRGRAICAAQIGALIAALAPAVPPPASAWVAGSGLAALGCSFLIDTRRLWRRSRTT